MSICILNLYDYILYMCPYSMLFGYKIPSYRVFRILKSKSGSDQPDSNQWPKEFYWQLQSSALPTELWSVSKDREKPTSYSGPAGIFIKKTPSPGIEPGAQTWKAWMLPTTPQWITQLMTETTTVTALTERYLDRERLVRLMRDTRDTRYTRETHLLLFLYGLLYT